MVLYATDRQGLGPIFARDSTHERPEMVLQIGSDNLATALRAEDAVEQGVDKGMRQNNLLPFQSSLRDENIRLMASIPSDESLGYCQTTLRVEIFAVSTVSTAANCG